MIGERSGQMGDRQAEEVSRAVTTCSAALDLMASVTSGTKWDLSGLVTHFHINSTPSFRNLHKDRRLRIPDRLWCFPFGDLL